MGDLSFILFKTNVVKTIILFTASHVFLPI